LSQLEQAERILTEVKDAEASLRALRVLARARLQAHPERADEAFDLVNRSIESARRQDKPGEVAHGWIARAEMRWQTADLVQARADTRSALEAIERVQTLQHDRQIKARVFGRFTSAYRRFSGQLLKRARLDEAFRITERMRAQVLLKGLRISDSPAIGTVAHDKDVSRRAGLRDQISMIQKRLMDPGLSHRERGQALGQLERLEIEWIAAGEQTGLVRADVPRLSVLQDALADDQALLFYQIDARKAREVRCTAKAEPTGGSWLLVATRGDARAYPLDDREELEPRIQMFLGLIERRDGSDKEGAARLYARLIQPAADQLRPIKRLVVVPDGPLYRLPFGALRPSSGESPLAASLQLSLAPSGTLWLRWQATAQRRASVPAIALADPELPFGDKPADHRAAGIFRRGLELGQLPYARAEARDLVSRLGGGSQVWEGAQASEQRVKHLALRDFGILHLAAHAVVDDRNPHRSAVVLAAGSREEDGLLQVPEIAELDMRGLVVLLSTCSSARGEVIEGEGALSLSRAFFQAGAQAVVGNLWRLRDDEASLLVQQFADHLARGESLGRALSQVKRDWIQSGKPAAAWAGLILQGQADYVPFPAGSAGWVLPLGIFGLVVLSGLALLLRRS
jgi:CHAT domain-containing protein